jgi:hypothetical protein
VAARLLRERELSARRHAEACLTAARGVEATIADRNFSCSTLCEEPSVLVPPTLEFAPTIPHNVIKIYRFQRFGIAVMICKILAEGINKKRHKI